MLHSEDDDDDSDNGGVDDQGIQSLIHALGEDGLAEAEQDIAMLDDDADDENLALDDLQDGELDGQDVVPTQKVEIDNQAAMVRILATIQLDPSLPWTETLATTFPQTIDVDVDDDLNRELAFYKQALECTALSRSLAASSKPPLPFTRPADFFAEMVKSDAHMARIRQRLLDEGAAIKKSEHKRREREGKKFGKQVQIEKLKERERGRKEMEERVKGLKRKRGDLLPADNGQDFDIAVEDAISDKPRPVKRGRGASRGRGITRDARDKKFGFGARDRWSKQNTRASTDDVSAFNSKRGSFGRGRGRGAQSAARGGRKRLGKSRRK